MPDLEAALRQFEAAESNLKKLEQLWEKIESLIGNGPAFGSPPEYDHACMAFRHILQSLPAIDGFRVDDHHHDFDEAGQMRLDALEVGEIDAQVSVESSLAEQGRILRAYRFKLQSKRRELVRDRMLTLIDEVDDMLRQLLPVAEGKEGNEYVSSLSEANWQYLQDAIGEIDTLLGSSDRPARWRDLKRHLSFGMVGICLIFTSSTGLPSRAALVQASMAKTILFLLVSQISEK